MGLYATIVVIIGYTLLSLILLPMQYKYIKLVKEIDVRSKELGLTTEEYYNKMSFENQELHFNAQGNPLFIGANLLATLLYNWKQKQN